MASYSTYCDGSSGAGTLAPEDRLCQACEETTVTHYNGKGEPVRTVYKRRLMMPAKIEAAEGIRKMLGWDKSMKAGEPEDDITERRTNGARGRFRAFASPPSNRRGFER